MVDVIAPEHVSVLFDTEDTYGDGGSASSPDFQWIGIIEDAGLPYDPSFKECRGIGSVDISALSSGMKNAEMTLKWFVQRKRTSPTYNPATFFLHALNPPTGLALGYEATYGSSYLSEWFLGVQIDSLEIDFDIEGFVKSSAKFVCQDVTIDDALIVANSRESNPLDVSTAEALPLTGHDVEVFVNEAGAADSPMTNIKRGKFYLKNNWVKIPVVRASDSDLLKYLLRGKRELGGEITVYVETKAELDFLTGKTLLDIRFDLHKTDNAPYFNFTNAKLKTGSLSTRVNEIPCELTLPFESTGLSIA